jgi:hypothetical protein
MGNGAMRYLCLSLVVCLLTWGQEGLAATSVGNSSLVVKTVTGVSEGRKRHLEFHDDIYHNETIHTFDDSAVEMTFLDETTLQLGPNSEIVLDEFVYDPDPSNSSFAITVVLGAFRFTSGILPSEAYKIKTPVATIGIRGTEIKIAVERTNNTEGEVITTVNLTVIEGEAYLAKCTGENILVRSGESRTIQGRQSGCSGQQASSSRP